jgi:hypothetical protein
MEQAIEQKTKRWTLDVLSFIVITRAVSHFEMSALNAAARENTVGAYVNAVAVEPEHKKKRNPKLLENRKLMEQEIEQEDKEVDVGRTR